MTARNRHLYLGIAVLMFTVLYVFWIVGGDGSTWVAGAYAAGVVSGVVLARSIH